MLGVRSKLAFARVGSTIIEARSGTPKLRPFFSHGLGCSTAKRRSWRLWGAKELLGWCGRVLIAGLVALAVAAELLDELESQM